MEDTLEEMLLMKGQLCKEFSNGNDKLYCSLFNNDWLIYKAQNGNEILYMLDTSKPFPLNKKDYIQSLNESVADCKALVEMDYWRA